MPAHRSGPPEADWAKASAAVGTQKTAGTALRLAASELSYAAASGWVGAVKSALCRWLQREPPGRPELTRRVLEPDGLRAGATAGRVELVEGGSG